MQEVLTKKFCKDVMRIFDEARAGPYPKDADSPSITEGKPNASAPPEAPGSPEGSGKES
jgi:hypothetical protein